MSVTKIFGNVWERGSPLRIFDGFTQISAISFANNTALFFQNLCPLFPLRHIQAVLLRSTGRDLSLDVKEGSVPTVTCMSETSVTNYRCYFHFRILLTWLLFLRRITQLQQEAKEYLRSKYVLRIVPPPCPICSRDMTNVKTGGRVLNIYGWTTLMSQLLWYGGVQHTKGRRKKAREEWIFLVIVN